MSSADLSKLDTLPPLPYVAHEILVAVNDRDASMPGIAQSLSREPGLAARVISMANSAFFADQRPLYNLHDALVRLGLNRVRVLAASVLLAQQFDASRCRPFRPERYWFTAVGTAFSAARVSRQMSTAGAGEDLSYLAGLLHNIGLPLLVHVFPDEMAAVLAQHQYAPEGSLAALTRAAVGIDHRAAGRLLLTEWGLPGELGDVCAHLHDSAYRGPHSALIALIRFCSQWTEAGFELPPPDGAPLAAEYLTGITQACLREKEQMASLAKLLAA